MGGGLRSVGAEDGLLDGQSLGGRTVGGAEGPMLGQLIGGSSISPSLVINGWVGAGDLPRRESACILAIKLGSILVLLGSEDGF